MTLIPSTASMGQPRPRRVGRRAQPSSHARATSRTGVLLVLPFAVLFVLGLVIPLAYAIYLSLYREQMIGGDHFVFLANYLRAATDPILWSGVAHIAVFILIQIPIGLVLALLSAVAIDSGRLRASPLFRLGIFLPFAVPSVVAALMWGYIYGPQFGLVGDVAHLLGVQAPNVLSRGGIIPAIANIAIWQSTGYNMLIFYAALKAVPGELYEAAELDGAGEWRKLLYIKLPSLRSTIGLVLFFSVVGGIQLFTEPSILQTLVPTVVTSGFTPNLYSYTLAFNANSYNYSAAVAVSLGLITIAAAVLAQVVTARRARRALPKEAA